MKAFSFNLALAMGLLVASGCNHPVLPIPPQVPHNIKHVLYPIGSAIQDTQSFNQLCKNYLKEVGPVPIRAFTIRAEDLLGSLGMNVTWADSAFCQNKFVRVYLGYNQGKGFKLFLVPVEGADLSSPDSTQWKGGWDMLLDAQGGTIRKKAVANTVNADEYVVDLNAPCPNTCAQPQP